MLHTVSQRFFFDAAHTLKRDIEAEGSRRVHGHTYHAEVWLQGERDPATGMVIDLGVLRLENRYPPVSQFSLYCSSLRGATWPCGRNR